MSQIERRGNAAPDDDRRGDATRVPPTRAPATGGPHTPATPGGATLLARGLARRCPMCGGRDLFPGWFAMRERCPSCGLRLDRGEHDFWIGAWMLNFVGVETLFVLLVVAGVALVWPDVPWTLVTWLGALGMLALPLLLFPTSRTLWLAIDLSFQPARESDFA